MTNEQQQVKEMMLAFNQECPEKPTIPSLEVRKLRAKLILEEALETIEGLGFRLKVKTGTSSDDGVLQDSSNYLFQPLDCGPSIKQILDGCEDLKVVTEGTLLACGLMTDSKREYEGLNSKYSWIDKKEDLHFNEVMRSNMSKMWTDEEVDKITGEGEAFDPTGIIASHTYCDENGTTYKNVGIKKWIVKDSTGKVIKSPSYSPPNFNIQ